MTSDDLAALKQRLSTARHQMVELMAADRDRAVPEPGNLHMVAAIDAVDREMADLPLPAYDEAETAHG